MNKVKIINDPVYGFLRFPEQELIQIINHPLFQRLRNIKQMGLAHLVYPGAMHSRLHHSLGACHLMGIALDELKAKDITISKEECLAARIAVLLHDIGHTAFSHSLEHIITKNSSHEKISYIIMRKLNEKFNGMLDMAIAIYDSSFSKKYLHQLVSSQLDVDRMDYLNRDSFYTGVSEGVIGYDRILQMLTVKNNELMVEEKGVHSVEKFIIARRLMYWQVYLHKTVLGTEQLLINIFRRAKELAIDKKELFTTPALHFFLYRKEGVSATDLEENPEYLELFCELDDHDIYTCIKVWQKHDDKVLSMLCQMLVLRKLYKVVLSSQSLASILSEKEEAIKKMPGFYKDNLQYFVFEGTTSNNTYSIDDDRIAIAMKDGRVKDISEIDNSLVNQTLAGPIHKNYICYIQ